MSIKNSRRDFLKTAALGGLMTAAGVSGEVSAVAGPQFSGKRVKLEKNDVILFQGDSITDWRRKTSDTAPNSAAALGEGYAMLTAGDLLLNNPGKDLKIYNRGVSGNKVYQLAERWEADCLALKPTVLSILVGVNDFWHTLVNGYTGTLKTYRDDYKALLDRTRQQLPGVKLIIGEPYAVNGVKSVDDKWYPAFDGYRQAAREIATEFGAVFIPYQEIYDKAQKAAPGSYWTIDGVHPSMAGAALMARAWMEAVRG
jgi:lysophospholipase L1-like esterase